MFALHPTSSCYRRTWSCPSHNCFHCPCSRLRILSWKQLLLQSAGWSGQTRAIFPCTVDWWHSHVFSTLVSQITMPNHSGCWSMPTVLRYDGFLTWHLKMVLSGPVSSWQFPPIQWFELFITIQWRARVSFQQLICFHNIFPIPASCEGGSQDSPLYWSRPTWPGCWRWRRRAFLGTLRSLPKLVPLAVASAWFHWFVPSLPYSLKIRIYLLWGLRYFSQQLANC